jgi:hypothetical protein
MIRNIFCLGPLKCQRAVGTMEDLSRLATDTVARLDALWQQVRGVWTCCVVLFELLSMTRQLWMLRAGAHASESEME